MRYDPFDGTLVPGMLVRRYKRFLADIRLDGGREITAHCPNSGSMLGMDAPGSPVWVQHVASPTRKLQWTWELISPDAGKTWVGCNTHRANDIAAWLVEQASVPGLGGHEVRREVRYGRNSRIDLLVGDHHVEVKNTTLARPPGPLPPLPGGASDLATMRRAYLEAMPGGVAVFPDAVTARGAKHMDELAQVAAEGGDATVLFLVNRGDCDRFAVARGLDPDYADAFDRARDAGVRMVPFAVEPSPGGWGLRGVLPLTEPAKASRAPRGPVGRAAPGPARPAGRGSAL